MAAKTALKVKAARLREEMTRTGRVVLRAPALVRGAECAIRFSLGQCSRERKSLGIRPFGLSMVGCSGSGLDGFAAPDRRLPGLSVLPGLTEGLRYVAAAILIFRYPLPFSTSGSTGKAGSCPW